MNSLWKEYCIHFDVRQHYTVETTARSHRAALRKAQELYERQAGQLFVFTLIDTTVENWDAEEICA